MANMRKNGDGDMRRGRLHACEILHAADAVDAFGEDKGLLLCTIREPLCPYSLRNVSNPTIFGLQTAAGHSTTTSAHPYKSVLRRVGYIKSAELAFEALYSRNLRRARRHWHRNARSPSDAVKDGSPLKDRRSLSVESTGGILRIAGSLFHHESPHTGDRGKPVLEVRQ